jgi:hypothetical protein
MKNPLVVSAVLAAVLIAGIAASVPWRGKPEAGVVTNSPPPPPSPPLPKPKPATPVKPMHKPVAPKPKSADSCAKLKTAEAFLTQAQLEAEAKKRGATPDQVRAAQKACSA